MMEQDNSWRNHHTNCIYAIDAATVLIIPIGYFSSDAANVIRAINTNSS